MIILLSPSKTLSKRPAPEVSMTEPAFLSDAQKLTDAINRLGPKLAKTLGVSEKIAELNRQRFSGWSEVKHSTIGKPAIYAYASDVYNGLAAFDMSEEEIAFAQKHLRILSGLYGVLRPTDATMPYRLEMSTKLVGDWGSNLYEFWGDRIAGNIMDDVRPSFVLNCASNEYAKSVQKHLPKSIPLITPKFLHDSGSGPRQKMTFAKYTRGLMARWAIENEINDPDQVTKFNAEGYRYHPELSEKGNPVFVAPNDFSLLGRFVKF